MVIAQELVGRPYIEFFGIKGTTIVWILIALVLGLIWTMTAYPEWWKNFYSKDKDKKHKYFSNWFKNKFWIILAMIVGLVALIFLVGTIVGFDTAMNSLMAKEGCQKIQCSDLGPSVDCPYCECLLCGDIVNIEIPVKR